MSYQDLVNMNLNTKLKKPKYNERIPSYVNRDLEADIASLEVYPILNKPFLYEKIPNHTSNLKTNISLLSQIHGPRGSQGSQGSQGSPGPKLPPRLPKHVREQRLKELKERDKQLIPALPSKYNRRKNTKPKPKIPPRKILDESGRPLFTPEPPSYPPPQKLLKHSFNVNFLKSLGEKIAKPRNTTTLTPPYGVSSTLLNAVPVAYPYHDKFPLQNSSNLNGVTRFKPSHYGTGPIEFLVKNGGKRKTRRKSKRKKKKSRRKLKNKRKTRRRKIKKNKKKSRRRKR
mgnify:CR=1 FL=1